MEQSLPTILGTREDGSSNTGGQQGDGRYPVGCCSSSAAVCEKKTQTTIETTYGTSETREKDMVP